MIANVIYKQADVLRENISEGSWIALVGSQIGEIYRFVLHAYLIVD